MRPLSVIIISFLFLVNTLSAQQIDQAFFSNADAFFKKEVENSRVDYASVKNNPDLATLIMLVENASISNLDATTKKAFFYKCL